MTELLNRMVRSAKRNILWYLQNYQKYRPLGMCQECVTEFERPVMCKELESYVLLMINLREKKDGTMMHETKPIHQLAFLLACEQFESEKRIMVQRPRDVPTPAIDNETIFTLLNGAV